MALRGDTSLANRPRTDHEHSQNAGRRASEIWLRSSIALADTPSTRETTRSGLQNDAPLVT
eukprot:15433318-Alexandrium_andersonii.AAC.1